MTSAKRIPGSFRDPDGFVFARDGQIYRQVQPSYVPILDAVLDSKFYDNLVRNGQAVFVEKVDIALAATSGAGQVIRPEQIPFISHPYEWSFGQLKSAALLTLTIARAALEDGFSLKDASAFNIQFIGPRPVFIDTLSFERYEEGSPWIAYRQFCRHFLGPLALMAYVDVRLGALLRSEIDGLPLDLASRLLPGSTKFKPGLLMHIHTHAAADLKSSGRSAGKAQFSRQALLGLFDSLEKTIENLEYKAIGTEWASYYDETNYSKASFERKRQLVAELISFVAPNAKLAWDLGANDATFSKLAADAGMYVVAWDADVAAVELSFRAKHANVLPLRQDFANPTADLGWLSSERDGFFARGPADFAIALALIHHLAIANNVPLDQVAEFFARCGEWVLVEWVPKEDSQVQRLLAARKDIFDLYTESSFVDAMLGHFDQIEARLIDGSSRKLFLFKRKS